MLAVRDLSTEELLAIDPDALADDELHELVVALHRDESRRAAVRARLLAAWDARRSWADDGSRSAATRIARECGLSSTKAHVDLKRARKLRTMPATKAALRDGTLSMDKADLLAMVNQPDVAHLFLRDESTLIGQIESVRYYDAKRTVQYWLQLAEDEVGKAPASVTRDGRHFNVARTLYGTFDLRGHLDALDGTEFNSELQRIEQQMFEADWKEARAKHGDNATADQLARTAGQRRADALVEMARRSRTMPAGGQRPRPLITLLAGYEGFSRICELSDGTVIAPADMLRLLSEADIERVVFDGPSRVIDVGVRQRLFTGATRRAIEVRDRHCQHPSGCDVPAERCQIDHILPWTEGGLTTQENGRCYCGFHNRGRNNERGPP